MKASKIKVWTGVNPSKSVSYQMLFKHFLFLSFALIITTVSFGQAPVVQNPSTLTAVGNVAYSWPVSATNHPASYAATGLPSGLTINITTGSISGTPISSGSFPVKLSATNATGTGTDAITIIVKPSIGNGSYLIASGEVGQAFTYTIAPTSSSLAYTYSATALPSGLSLNTSTGVISGTPTVANTSVSNLTATNSVGTATILLNLTINP